MIQFHVYPGGVKRIVTFSFDDGFSNDARLIHLMDQYGLRGTFHLNGINHRNDTEEQRISTRELYSGHEIACHTLSHGWPSRMPSGSLVTETMQDRMVLEQIAGCPVTGMSYPSGSYDTAVIKAMAACGIEYSRTTKATNDFDLPYDLLEWHPTCHFKDAAPCIERFLQGLDSQWVKPLLYIWGHSHELRSEQDWADMEQLLSSVAGRSEIWYATNGEIADYLHAQRLLKVSVDEKHFYNPSALDVWVERDKRERICIPAGQRLTINE